MYPILLSLHSLFRWLALASLLYTTFHAYRGWVFNKPFTGIDHIVRQTASAIIHTQLLIGLWLYRISPITNYFTRNFSAAIHQREIRFFGMEHSTMMLLAVVIITIGSSKSKRKVTDKQKFRTMAIWFSIGLFIILTSIPWTFSPLTSRPYFRPF